MLADQRGFTADDKDSGFSVYINKANCCCGHYVRLCMISRCSKLTGKLLF